MTEVVEVAGGTVTAGGSTSGVTVDDPDGSTIVVSPEGTTVTVDPAVEVVSAGGGGTTVVATGTTAIQIVETGSSGGGLGDVGKGFRLSTLNSGDPFDLQNSSGQPSQGICGLPTVAYDDFGAGASTISVDDANGLLGGGPQPIMTPVEWGSSENGWVWQAPVAGRWHHDLSVIFNSNAADDIVYAILLKADSEAVCGAIGWSHASAALGVTWAQVLSSANFDAAAGEIVWLQLLTISPDGIAPVRISDSDAVTSWSGYLIST